MVRLELKPEDVALKVPGQYCCPDPLLALHPMWAVPAAQGDAAHTGVRNQT